MQLTKYGDYAKRTLIYLVLADRFCTIQEIAASCSIPINYLVKAVNQLAGLGRIESTRVNRGGIRLAPPLEKNESWRGNL